MPREPGAFPPAVAQTLLRIPRRQAHAILDALQRLCDDPNLLALQEEGGEQFFVAAGYVVFVDIDDDTVTVIRVRRLGAD